MAENDSFLSEQEALEKFPSDHFEEDENLYDSEFGSAIHDKSQASSAVYESRRPKNEDKLTTIDEASEVSDDPFPSALKIGSSSKNGWESVKSLGSIKNLRNPSLGDASKESSGAMFKVNLLSLSPTPVKNYQTTDLQNYSFKPAKEFLDFFNEDAKRVSKENFLHPDQITDEMMKKQHTWEPSLLTSPPIYVENTQSLLKLDQNRHEKSKTGASRLEKSKVLGEANIRVENQPSVLKSNTSLPIRRPGNASGLIKNTSFEQEKGTGKEYANDMARNRAEFSPQLPTLVEDKENMRLQSQIDFDVASKLNQKTSSPNERASKENPRKDLSNLCQSISIIQQESPKSRHFNKDDRFSRWIEEQSQDTLATRRGETLSSSAIGRGLQDMNSMMSGNTEAQVNAALALIKLKHKNKEMDPKLGELGMIKDRMENQILESKYKKIGGRNHSIKHPISRSKHHTKHDSRVEHTARSIQGVPSTMFKHRTSSQSPKVKATLATIRSIQHSTNLRAPKPAQEGLETSENAQPSRNASNVPETSKNRSNFSKIKPKLVFSQEADIEEPILFTVPYVSIKADPKTHVYLKNQVFEKNSQVMDLLEKLIEENPVNQVQFLKEYVSKLA